MREAEVFSCIAWRWGSNGKHGFVGLHWRPALRGSINPRDTHGWIGLRETRLALSCTRIDAGKLDAQYILSSCRACGMQDCMCATSMVLCQYESIEQNSHQQT